MSAKRLSNIIVMFLMILSTTIAFFSCSEDDVDISGNSIVGTWISTDHYYGGSDTFTFKPNGTYSWSYSGTLSWFDDESGNYAYDSSRSTLTIHNEKGTSWLYWIVSLTSSSFTIIDEDGYTYYYQRK